jgi:monofunctional glycosyltransferase
MPNSSSPSRGRRRKRDLLLLAVLALVLAIAVLGVWMAWSPPLGRLREHNPERTALMELRQAQARARGRAYRIAHTWVPLRDISPYLRDAVLAAEDDTFFRHAGLDLEATWYSLRRNLKRGGYVQGGSTLTQQVVKNLYLSPHKSIWRKLKEAMLALELERVLGKRRILEIYLNIAEWGPGVFGAEAAARTYFGTSAAALSLEQAVALVAVLPSPLRHSPVRPDRYLAWRVPWVWRQLSYMGYAAPAATPEEVLPDPTTLAEDRRDEPAEDPGDDGGPSAAEGTGESAGEDATAPAPGAAEDVAPGAVTATAAGDPEAGGTPQ